MYSPKIDPLLIPPLYHLGQARKKPMTAVVNDLLFRALVGEELTDDAARRLDAARFKYQAHAQQPQTRKEQT